MEHKWWHTVLPCLLVSMTAGSLTNVTCPIPCTCGPKRVQCQKNARAKNETPQNPPPSNETLRSVPGELPHNNTVQSLAITNMDIQHVTASDFNHLLLLQQLDLTRNRIETVADTAFQSLRDLQSLWIGDNFLRELTDDTFAGLANLKELDLSRNRLVELNAMSFQPLKNLEVLNLASNEIEHIVDEAFVGLHRLQTLILSGNKLMELRENQFKPLYSLETLMLDDCNIQVIQIFAFKHLERLSHLSLANNKMVGHLLAENFVRDSKTVLSFLDVLSLRGTGIKEVPVAALKTFPRLKSLDLSQTLIPVIRNSSFAPLYHLVNLTLDALPRLYRLEENAFLGLDSLRYLTIANNRLLNNISDGAFGNLSSLRYLDLSNNNLEAVPRGLADWQNIDVLDLRGNPLHCDCSAAWMLTVLYARPKMAFSKKARNTRVEDMCDKAGTEDQVGFTAETLTQRVACRSPARFQGRCLLSLTAEELCSSPSPDPRLQVGVLVASVLGASLLLCVLLVLFRRRVRQVCRGGYHPMHRTRGDSRQSSLVDVLEMETTQLDDVRDS